MLPAHSGRGAGHHTIWHCQDERLRSHAGFIREDHRPSLRGGHTTSKFDFVNCNNLPSRAIALQWFTDWQLLFARSGSVDDIVGVSESIIMGIPMPTGTGLFKLHHRHPEAQGPPPVQRPLPVLAYT
eukprot:scaffold418741_cov43-Prasinocladus_malaysianus.AAC.1